MEHFVMVCNGVFPSAALDSGPDLGDPPWMSGQPVRNVIEPLVYRLDANRPGNIRAMYADTEYPLMCNDLVDALHAVGVDNLQLFSAVVIDPATGAEHRD